MKADLFVALWFKKRKKICCGIVFEMPNMCLNIQKGEYLSSMTLMTF